MTTSNISKNNQQLKRAWAFTIILVLVGGFIFVRPYLSILLLACLAAYLSYPIYKWLLGKTKNNRGASATITTFITFLIVIIPVAIVITLAIIQGIGLIDRLNVGDLFIGDENFEDNIESLVAEVNIRIFNIAGITDAISTQGVMTFLDDTLPGVLQAAFDRLIDLVSAIPAFITNAIIFLFVYIGLLLDGDKLIKTIRELSPFDDKVNNTYFKRVGLMASSMFRGQMLIAFLQGLGSAFSLYLIGFGDFFWFFLVAFTLLSLIPLGAGIITIPIGILLILFGQVWRGIFVLAVHFVYVTNIDNIRPKLVPKEARLPAALTIVAAFAGVTYFGLFGVIYGPIIMIFIVTTIEMYIESKKALAK